MKRMTSKMKIKNRIGYGPDIVLASRIGCAGIEAL